jgi:hypothetical protein
MAEREISPISPPDQSINPTQEVKPNSAQTEVYGTPPGSTTSGAPEATGSKSSVDIDKSAGEIATLMDQNDAAGADKKLRECVQHISNVEEFKKLVFAIERQESNSVGVDLTLVDEKGNPVTEDKAFDFMTSDQTKKQGTAEVPPEIPAAPKETPQAAADKEIERAKALNTELQEKSPTLKALYEQWNSTPWTKPDPNNPEQGQILLKNDSNSVVYDAKKSQMIIGAPTDEGLKAAFPNSTETERKQAIDQQTKLLPELVAHQMYAATHQSIDDLYGGATPVEKDKYVDLRLNDMAGAYLAEIKVNRELGNTDPVSFAYKDTTGADQKENMNDLLVFSDASKQTIDEKASSDKIKDFLVNFHREGQPPLAINKQIETEFDSYSKNFAQNKEMLGKKGFLAATPEVSATPTPEVPATPTPEVPATPTPEVPATPTPEVPATPTPVEPPPPGQ